MAEDRVGKYRDSSFGSVHCLALTAFLRDGEMPESDSQSVYATAANLMSKESRIMKGKQIAAFFAAASLSVSASAGTAAVKPKITMEQARATALKRAPGKVKSEELENEHGKLIYSFDIATSKNAITEVNVDAVNGRIVAVQHENAAKEAAEKQQEAKEKPAKH